MVRLKLPYPVSANRYWRIWRNKAVRSAEATAYKSVVRRIAQEAGVMPSEGSVAVCLRLIPKEQTKTAVQTKPSSTWTMP